MKIQSISNIFFKGKPNNYAKIDEHITRSAQPLKDDFAWLKEQGVTDIINFRVMYESAIDFDEKEEVEKLGLRYHNIPTITKRPNEEKVIAFLKLIETIKENKGKAHIHCKAGADRTGMYAFIYKMLKGLGTLAQNEAEWYALGYHADLYPDLKNWAKNMVIKLKK